MLELLELTEETELCGLLPELLSGFGDWLLEELELLEEAELCGLLPELLSGFEELALLEELVLTEEELSGLLPELLSGVEDRLLEGSELSIGTLLESPPFGTLSGSAELSPPEDEYVLSSSAPLEITLLGIITILGRSVTELQPAQSIKTDKTAANRGNFFLIIRSFLSSSISNIKP